ncbi:MAG: PilZ domain-containing protein [Phycisphaerales bacterium]|nr:PilZ domain-containing protein [Phycisphaerales bacterium]
MSTPNRRPIGKPGATTDRPNTVNLRLTALHDLLDRLERRPTGKSIVPRRRIFARWPFRRETVQLEIARPGGNAATIRVACRNLSRGGLGVLHNAYVHTGSDCRVLLTHYERGETWIDGRIVRCVHRGGVVHELGIQFHEPIVLGEFMPRDAFAPVFSLERVDPSSLAGSVLHVSDDLTQRQLVRRHLQNTRLRLTSVSTIDEALPSAAVYDVALLAVPTAEAVAASGILRESGFGGAILMVAPDASPPSRSHLADAPCRAILVMPLTGDMLLRALAEVLIIDAAVAQSSLDDMDTCASEHRTPHACRELQAAMQDDNPQACRQACIRLADDARQLGWGSVAALATAAARDLSQRESIGPVKSAMDALLDAFRAA